MGGKEICSPPPGRRLSEPPSACAESRHRASSGSAAPPRRNSEAQFRHPNFGAGLRAASISPHQAPPRRRRSYPSPVKPTFQI
ncbi:putative pollen-specific leucine-rich repeat extensin-like protein 3 [Iris pallida]|uniref:Pollen-specific leucine-rich repeat extensin-like protein 3 n=1 Tax=Iris pallida TaxID=29817 RepID=A0AAX6ILJ3_IRIPA|nr:putative pollen-specific leucine-rich repeat extensin-like protein 3 [Iris pallida]